MYFLSHLTKNDDFRIRAQEQDAGHEDLHRAELGQNEDCLDGSSPQNFYQSHCDKFPIWNPPPIWNFLTKGPLEHQWYKAFARPDSLFCACHGSSKGNPLPNPPNRNSCCVTLMKPEFAIGMGNVFTIQFESRGDYLQLRRIRWGRLQTDFSMINFLFYFLLDWILFNHAL